MCLTFRFILFCFLFFILLFLIVGFYFDFGLGINLTYSAPVGFYVYYRLKGSLTQGEKVDFFLKETQNQLSHDCIKKGEYGLKQVGAMPGDWLFSYRDNIYSCRTKFMDKDCNFLGHCLSSDSNGRLIHCQKWNAYQIPKDYYYLSSKSDPRSCDSGYFGLVNRSQILHKLFLLFPYLEALEYFRSLFKIIEGMGLGKN